MKRRIFLLAAIMAVSACSEIPKDPEGTTERVRSAKILRVGIVAPGGTVSPGKQTEFLRRMASASHARPITKEGPAEILLEELEEGKLDIVLGEFSTKSPWTPLVHFTPPLEEKVTRDGHSLLTAAVRNGENEWVSIVHREVAAVAGGGR